jgi:hypothetical protein
MPDVVYLKLCDDVIERTSDALRPAGRDTVYIPKGVCHAVEPGATNTVCGESVSNLKVIPEERWEDGPGNRCPKCLTEVPVT